MVKTSDFTMLPKGVPMLLRRVLGTPRGAGEGDHLCRRPGGGERCPHPAHSRMGEAGPPCSPCYCGTLSPRCTAGLRAYGLEPAVQVRVVGPVDAVPLPPPDPAEAGDVGDGVVAGEEVALRKPAIHHAVEPVRLGGVALDGVGHLHLGEAAKMLAWPNIGPTPPIWNMSHSITRQPAAFVRRNQLAGLVGEIEQDRAGLEERDRLPIGPIGIDDRRDLVVRADLEEFRLELFVSPDVDGMDPVREPDLLQHDRGLDPVRRAPGIEVDHCLSPTAPRTAWRRT